MNWRIKIYFEVAFLISKILNKKIKTTVATALNAKKCFIRIKSYYGDPFLYV